jgi:hypothetical protein
MRRVITAIISIAGMCAGFTPDGTWVQPLSNYYVQTTSEVDWKCVRVNFTTEGGITSMTKRAYLHDMTIGQQTTTVPVSVAFDTETMTMILGGQEVFDLRQYTEQLIVVTGRESPSLFVWATNYTRYTTEDSIDLVHHLVDWQYTNIDKTPTPSYSPVCDEAIFSPHPRFSHRYLRVAR